MRVLQRLIVIVVAFLGLTAAASATVRIHIDLSTQRMHVSSSSGSYTWPVSTARAGYVTPRGSFSPKSLQPMHYSRKYHMSPMPHSIFFSGGFAIHGTYATGALGRPASHGCVRLAPGNAAALYRMVQSEGGHITIGGSSGGGARYAHRHGSTRYAAAHGRQSGHALAYAASGRRHGHPSVRSWQANPLHSLFGD
jgi:hypothetical protein